MKKIWDWIKNNPNRTMFLIPIILVAGISISHVVSWYDISNPFNWAVYLSIAVEVGAMTALIAATNKIKGGVWFMFGLVTLIQMIGNIFFSFKEIDENGELFRSWVELTSPLWEMLGSDISDLTSQKRWLAFLEGGLLPIISLTSLHFFTKYDGGNNDTVKEIIVEKIVEVPVEKEIIVEKEVIVEKIVEVPVEKEIIVEKEVIVEKIVEVPVEQTIQDTLQNKDVIIETFEDETSETSTQEDDIVFDYPPNQKEQTYLAAKRLTYSRPN
jgi:hypothetical protein